MANDLVDSIVERFIRELSEHTESIRVFVTYPDGNDETCALTMGHGNYYAQRGQVDSWVNMNTAKDQIIADAAMGVGDDED